MTIEEMKNIRDSIIATLDTRELTPEQFAAVISALDKKIPKKPLPDNRYFGIGKCPDYEAVFTDKTTHFCGNCGQALDWSDEK